MNLQRYAVATLAVAALSLTVIGAARAYGGGLSSGLNTGAALSPFRPTHVTGPDQGTQTCPVCKYPRNPAVQAWINTDDDKNVAKLASTLEQIASANPAAHLKAFVVYMNPTNAPASALEAKLRKIGDANKLQNVSLVFLPGAGDPAVQAYGVNTDRAVRNTIFVYRNRTVEAKFVNWQADASGVAGLRDAVAKVLPKA